MQVRKPLQVNIVSREELEALAAPMLNFIGTGLASGLIPVLPTPDEPEKEENADNLYRG